MKFYLLELIKNVDLSEIKFALQVLGLTRNKVERRRVLGVLEQKGKQIETYTLMSSEKHCKWCKYHHCATNSFSTCDKSNCELI